MNCLVMVDIQNDFLPGGALAAPEGDRILPIVNEIQSAFDLIVATKDWHPSDHESFAITHNLKEGEIIDLHGVEQILWPVHCVQNSFGAEFPIGLNTDLVDRTFLKGTDPTVDSYSAFFDNARRRATGLGDYLKEKGVDEVYIVGIATDYCVLYSALDARSLGFDTYLVRNGCCPINLEEGDEARAIAKMKEAGCHIVYSDEIKKPAP